MSDLKIWFGKLYRHPSIEIAHDTPTVTVSGTKVIVTLRKPEVLADLTARYPPTQLLVVKVDVTIITDITAAFAKAQEVFGRIDVVFNNAGVTLTSELESLDSTSESYARNVMDVNFWGAAHVSKEAVRFFREVNKPSGGRLLQVSSRVGLVGGPVYGFYSASKFALEDLSESLAAELDPAWNIKVTILEPGPYRTRILGHNHHDVPQHPAYADPDSLASQIRKNIASPELWDGDVNKAAIVIEMFTRLEDAPIRFPLHRSILSVMRDKANALAELADTYETWTMDLYHDKRSIIDERLRHVDLFQR